MSFCWTKTLVDHNRYGFVSLLVVAIGLFVSIGCENFVKVQSPISHKPVTEAELRLETQQYKVAVQVEFDALAVKSKQMDLAVQGSSDEIEKKKTIIMTALKTFGSVAGVGTPWGGLVTIATGLVATGLGLDNRRKDAVIEAKNESINTAEKLGQKS